MRRRGRGNNNRKPSHHQQHHHQHHGRNQTFDSNGPGVRLRGTAHQIYEKYLTLGRDAASSGDRIMSESYLQHADHYYRYILANQGPLQEFQDRNDGQDGEMESEVTSFGQGEQPSNGDQQPQPNYQPQPPQNQAFNGGQSEGTPLPGPSQPRNEGEGQHGGQGQHNQFRRDRFNRRFNRDNRQGQGNYQDQGGERRDGDRRDGDRQGNERQGNDRQGGDRQGGDRQHADRQGGERRDNRNDNRGDNRNENRNEYRGDNRNENRGNRDGDRQNRQPRRSEEEAFEPPAFLKAERPASDSPPPRDPFNRDDEQN
jgi:hypothetical protein